MSITSAQILVSKPYRNESDIKTLPDTTKLRVVLKHYFLKEILKAKMAENDLRLGGPGWLSQLSIQLWLRS